MAEVAAEAVARRQKADDTYFSQMRQNVAVKREKWAERIKKVANAQIIMPE